MYRGIIHFHSNYSYDSLLSIKNIIKFALENNINFLILTDHETIKGSVALKQYVDSSNLNIDVLIAAEFNTEYGDIIAIDIKHDIKNMKFDEFIKEVKDQGGILLFPHPYKGHKNINYIAEKVDIIEVFNSRTDELSNKKAQKLANKYRKKRSFASDAHNFNSLKNCIIEFEKNGSLKESLLLGSIKPVTNYKTYVVEIIFSQFIKAYKRKDIILFLKLVKNLIKNIISFQIFKRV